MNDSHIFTIDSPRVIRCAHRSVKFTIKLKFCKYCAALLNSVYWPDTRQLHWETTNGNCLFDLISFHQLKLVVFLFVFFLFFSPAFLNMFALFCSLIETALRKPKNSFRFYIYWVPYSMAYIYLCRLKCLPVSVFRYISLLRNDRLFD